MSVCGILVFTCMRNQEVGVIISLSLTSCAVPSCVVTRDPEASESVSLASGSHVIPQVRGT